MYLFLGFMMLMVIGSFVLLVTGAAEVEKLRAQNRYLVEQIARMRQEQGDLLKALQQAPLQTVAVTAGVPEALAAPVAGDTVPMTTALAAPLIIDEASFKKMRANARTLQTVIEGFALDHAGGYPASLRELEAYAIANAANVTITNPFNGSSGFITDSDCSLDISETPVDEGVPDHAGKLLFQSNLQGDEVVGYMIAALDGAGFLLKESDGQPFTLGT